MQRREPSRRSLRAHAVAVGILALIAALMTACPRSQKPSPVVQDLIHTYIVRGRVAMVPEASKPLTEFMVHHEAIPDFIRQDGTLGMGEMTMAFPLEAGVELNGIGAGDVVELELNVRWKPKAKFWTSRVTKLPPETVLKLTGRDPP